LANQDLILVPALSPTAVYDPVTHLVSLSKNFAGIIGQDDSVVWGDTLFLTTLTSIGSRAVWGADDSVVWGDSTNLGFSSIWGASVNLSIPLTASSATDDDQ
jgi:hypothetical protein